jgi:hypothetical protein
MTTAELSNRPVRRGARTDTGSPYHCPDATERAGPQWTGPLRAGMSYLLSSEAFFSTSSIPPQRKNACSGRWS